MWLGTLAWSAKTAMKRTKIAVIARHRVSSLRQLGSFQRTLTLATGSSQGTDEPSTGHPTRSDVNGESEVTANFPSPQLSQKGLSESVPSGCPIQSHDTANAEPTDRMGDARPAAQTIPSLICSTSTDQASTLITDLNSVCPDIVFNTLSSVVEESAMASEQATGNPPHARSQGYSRHHPAPGRSGIT
jgi:hypothetical protein